MKFISEQNHFEILRTQGTFEAFVFETSFRRFLASE